MIKSYKYSASVIKLLGYFKAAYDYEVTKHLEGKDLPYLQYSKVGMVCIQKCSSETLALI